VARADDHVAVHLATRKDAAVVRANVFYRVADTVEIEHGYPRAVISNELIDVQAVWPKVAHLRPKVRHVVDTLVELAEQGVLD